MAEPMSDARLECLAGLAELPCTCGVADCENFMSALTREEAQELVAEARRARADGAQAGEAVSQPRLMFHSTSAPAPDPVTRVVVVDPHGRRLA